MVFNKIIDFPRLPSHARKTTQNTELQQLTPHPKKNTSGQNLTKIDRRYYILMGTAITSCHPYRLQALQEQLTALGYQRLHILL